MFRKLLLISTISIFLPLGAKEVCFIPGWYSQWIYYGNHVQRLEKLFPQEKITVCKWDSNRLWSNAKHAANGFVRKFSVALLERQDTADITLIGHSLGGRIVLDCAAILAQNRRQVRQIILLGTAGEMSSADIRNCQQVSLLPVINICCPDDNMLKLFYHREKFMPLGLAGVPRRYAHIRQYRMRVPDDEITLLDMVLLTGTGAEPFRETAAHLAAKYLLTLEKVLTDAPAEYYLDLAELEKIAAENSVKNDFLPGYRISAAANGWKFARRRFRNRFRITSPAGKFFYYDSEAAALRTWKRLLEIMKY